MKTEMQILGEMLSSLSKLPLKRQGPDWDELQAMVCFHCKEPLDICQCKGY